MDLYSCILYKHAASLYFNLIFYFHYSMGPDLSIIALSNVNTRRVYLHGIVMMFAFTYLLAQGVALVRVCPSSRHCARITHSIFNTLSLLFGIAGLILIISYKSENNVSFIRGSHG